ncbi:MAG: glycerate kinase, partial [Achromobacter mucicolens]
MKIVIAPDSFKESVSAPDAAAAIARGVKAAFPGA